MNFLALLPIFSTLIERLFPDKEKAAEAALEMQKVLNQAQAAADTAEASKIESASKVVVAEASSGNWMAANWRPCLMFLFMGLLANQYFLAPILVALHVAVVISPLPPEAWNLLEIGVGGYVVGRSGEKMTKSYATAKFNHTNFYNVLRAKIFKQGMSQDQVDAVEEAIKEAQS